LLKYKKRKLNTKQEEFILTNKSTQDHIESCRTDGRMTLFHTHLYTFFFCHSPTGILLLLLTILLNHQIMNDYIYIYIYVVLLTLFCFSNVSKSVNTGVCTCMSDCCCCFFSFFRSYLCSFFASVFHNNDDVVLWFFVVFLLFILYMYTLKKRHTYTVMIKFIPLGDLFLSSFFLLSICLLYSYYYFFVRFFSSSFDVCLFNDTQPK
jgi:hypothetical protein